MDVTPFQPDQVLTFDKDGKTTSTRGTRASQRAERRPNAFHSFRLPAYTTSKRPEAIRSRVTGSEFTGHIHYGDAIARSGRRRVLAQRG